MSKEIPKIVLITEDEKPYLRALTLKLTNAGFDVKNAEDGESAIKIIAEKKCDLILLDLIMPKVDGFGVLEYMQKNNISIPTIVLTNLGQLDDEKRGRKLGAIDFLNKSNIQIVEVIERVQSLLK